MTSLFVVPCAIWYHVDNLKNVKNTHGGVLLLVKLQAEACNFTKSNTPPWVFFTFFKLSTWYQIAQRTKFLILVSFPQWNLHKQHTLNQNIQRTKWFTILESQFIVNLELFCTKKIPVFTLYTMGGILGGDSKSERSKKLKSSAI